MNKPWELNPALSAKRMWRILNLFTNSDRYQVDQHKKIESTERVKERSPLSPEGIAIIYKSQQHCNEVMRHFAIVAPRRLTIVQ